MSKKAVLMLNLGSPESTNVEDVRVYLREFLMDKCVINKPFLVRWLVVNCFILPTRPKNSAEAYSNIWTDEGSPLIVTSRKVQSAVADKVDVDVELGMRYGNPSTPDAIKQLHESGVTELFVMPLYPHYAMSSYETAVEWTKTCIQKYAPGMKADFLPPFYNDPAYIDALAEVSKPYLEKEHDQVLFSFHGIPESHLRVTDPTNNHCLSCENCCDKPSEAHKTCYRHQCLETVKLFAEKAGLKEGKYQTSFQSRLGREPWLSPYTDFRLREMPGEGIKKLLIMSPAFVADNLETLEELSMEGKEIFMEAGGEFYEQIPCLNMNEKWLKFLTDKIDGWLAK